MRYVKPIPQVQAGGMQPYRKDGVSPSPPGLALLAMLAGRTAGGWNPADVQREMQRAIKGKSPSLLDALRR